MKDGIHPKYVDSVVTCGCGNTFNTRSTKPKITVEVCSKCHPFFTGSVKFVDAAGRGDKFNKKVSRPSPRASSTRPVKTSRRPAGLDKVPPGRFL